MAPCADRFFAQRRISASLHNGRDKFQKSGGGVAGVDEEEEEREEKARLAKFEQFLERDS